MGAKHVAETLVEINKKLSSLIDMTSSDNSFQKHKGQCIEHINTIIRQLDHLVEELQK